MTRRTAVHRASSDSYKADDEAHTLCGLVGAVLSIESDITLIHENGGEYHATSHDHLVSCEKCANLMAGRGLYNRSAA
jgi:hypothetical protein